MHFSILQRSLSSNLRNLRLILDKMVNEGEGSHPFEMASQYRGLVIEQFTYESGVDLMLDAVAGDKFVFLWLDFYECCFIFQYLWTDFSIVSLTLLKQPMKYCGGSIGNLTKMDSVYPVHSVSTRGIELIVVHQLVHM